jgi:hypothetical protein
VGEGRRTATPGTAGAASALFSVRRNGDVTLLRDKEAVGGGEVGGSAAMQV